MIAFLVAGAWAAELWLGWQGCARLGRAGLGPRNQAAAEGDRRARIKVQFKVTAAPGSRCG